MLDTFVRYLRGAAVPFRLASYPSPERQPRATHPLPPHGMLVDSRFVLVGGRLVLACWPYNETLDLIALGNELGGGALEVLPSDLPSPLDRFEGTIPPLGQIFGVPVVVDERIERECGVVVFEVFHDSDYIEIPYDDFSRQEQPRIAAFALAGELPEATQPSISQH
jgi:hypothetical protein